MVNPDGKINHTKLNAIVRDICLLKKEGYSVVLVTSGSIGVGMSILGLQKRPKELPLKRACAAMGQIHLMKQYSTRFERRQQHVAQLLLSGEDFKNKERYQNIRDTLNTLLAQGVVPIINENDTISHKSEVVGDNDKLSSDIAHFLEADMLVLLSDEDGLYNKNPKIHSDAELISIVPKVSPEIEKLGGGAGSETSTGGMRSKLQAIKQATSAGTPVILAPGKKIQLAKIVHGKKLGSLFLPNPKKLKYQKRWLAYVSKPHGRLYLDDGAIAALLTGKSLLAVGVVKILGHFKKGEFVEISPLKGSPIGRGQVEFSTEELHNIRGLKSGEISKLMKRSRSEEVIHRDKLVIY